MIKILPLLLLPFLITPLCGQALVVSGPVVGSGTLNTTWSTQPPNSVLIGPTSGGNATPGFRLLTVTDIPDLSSLYAPIGGGGGTITLTGDVTGAGTSTIVTVIGVGKVTNAMLAGSIAFSKLIGTDITTVGTVTGGTWQGTVIGSSFGGAGAVSGLLKANGSGTVSAAVAGTDYLTGNQTITVSGDASGSGATAITLSIGTGKVTNAMLAGSIAFSKLIGTDITTVGTITSGAWQGTVIGSSFGGAGAVNGLLKSNGSGTVSAAVAGTDYLTGNQTITLSGDLSGSGSTSISATIGNGAVTFTKVQNIATATVLGRSTAGTGSIEALTGTQATALLDVFGTAVKGLAPASGGGTTNFLRADGTWAAPAGGSGGDSITVNGSAVTDANFNATTPAAISGSANVTWQTSGSGPAQISSYLDLANLSTPRVHKPSYWSDFLSTNTVQNVFIGVAISSGTNTTAPASGVVTGNHPGVVLMRSSTTANSGWKYQTDITQFLIGGGEVFDIVFRTPAALTNTTYRFGLLDTVTSADAVDGAYFEVAATGVAVGKTSSNSTRSTTATIATLVVNTWYHARAVVNTAATQVDFTIYSEAGSSLGTASLTTNIPTVAGRETGAGFIGTNSGTTASDVANLDYMAITFTRSLQRGFGN